MCCFLNMFLVTRGSNNLHIRYATMYIAPMCQANTANFFTKVSHTCGYMDSLGPGLFRNCFAACLGPEWYQDGLLDLIISY